MQHSPRIPISWSRLTRSKNSCPRPIRRLLGVCAMPPRLAASTNVVGVTANPQSLNRLARGIARRNRRPRHTLVMSDLTGFPAGKYADPIAEQRTYRAVRKHITHGEPGRTAYPARRRRSVSVCRVPSFQPSRFGELIEGDDGHQDEANDDLLDIRVHVHQHEAVDQHADQHRADDRAEDRADPAEQ
jgi:hypothetical protein